MRRATAVVNARDRLFPNHGNLCTVLPHAVSNLTAASGIYPELGVDCMIAYGSMKRQHSDLPAVYLKPSQEL